MNQPINSSPTCKEGVERCSTVKLKWKRDETRPIRCITESTQDISHKANNPAPALGIELVQSLMPDRRVAQFDQTL